MITPASVADWALFAGMMGSLSALAACGSRWALQETSTPERVRSRPYSATRTVHDRASGCNAQSSSVPTRRSIDRSIVANASC